jgi:hypothetical protein
MRRGVAKVLFAPWLLPHTTPPKAAALPTSGLFEPKSLFALAVPIPIVQFTSRSKIVFLKVRQSHLVIYLSASFCWSLKGAYYFNETDKALDAHLMDPSSTSMHKAIDAGTSPELLLSDPTRKFRLCNSRHWYVDCPA